MSDKAPPDWAIEKALAKFHEFNSSAYWSVKKIRTTCDRSQLGFCSMVIAHATLIAEHEDAPIDPLLLEAREIVAAYNMTVNKIFADRVLAGHSDRCAEISAAIAGVRRGIEIGKAEA